MFRGHRPMANNSRLHTTLGVLTPFAFVLISRKYPLLSFLPDDKCSAEKVYFSICLKLSASMFVPRRLELNAKQAKLTFSLGLAQGECQ